MLGVQESQTILDYVICSADPRAGSTVLEVQRCGKGGGAWTSKVAIKRSRSIEANTLTSTYQSSCLAIKQLPTSKILPVPSPRRLLVELRRQGTKDLVCEIDLHFPPTAEQGGESGGRSNCKIVGSTRVVSLSFWLWTWGTTATFQPRV